MLQNGNVGIGSSNPSSKLYVNADFRVANKLNVNFLGNRWI